MQRSTVSRLAVVSALKDDELACRVVDEERAEDVCAKGVGGLDGKVTNEQGLHTCCNHKTDGGHAEEEEKFEKDVMLAWLKNEETVEDVAEDIGDAETADVTEEGVKRAESIGHRLDAHAQ